MAQNIQHWLFERDRFTWAREHVPSKKWYQITKYFPGYRLRRQMMYIDAESGRPVPAEGGEEVPAGCVYIYGYDLRNFCGIDVPGLDEAMTARPLSRVERERAERAEREKASGQVAADAPMAGAPAPAQAPVTPSTPAE